MLNGTQPDFEGRVYWVFVCKEKGRHTFNALPDRTAPSTTEEYTKWRLEQKAKLAGVKLEKQLQ
jgi:rRNA maturation protein Nop10